MYTVVLTHTDVIIVTVRDLLTDLQCVILCLGSK